MAMMLEGPEACESRSAASGRPGIWLAGVRSAVSEKVVVPRPRSLRKFRRLGLSISWLLLVLPAPGRWARRLHWLRKLIWTCCVKLQYILVLHSGNWVDLFSLGRSQVRFLCIRAWL